MTTNPTYISFSGGGPMIKEDHEPKFHIGELVIPHDSRGAPQSGPVPIEDIYQLKIGVYYYKLKNGSRGGLEEWKLRRVGEPWNPLENPWPKVFPTQVPSELANEGDNQREAVISDVDPLVPNLKFHQLPNAEILKPQKAPPMSGSTNKTQVPKISRWTVAELYDTEFPEPRWIVPGLIPVGLTIIGGRPKVGKSLFMMNVTAAVGTGGKFFGRDIVKGEVLYLFLEDAPRVLKDRQAKMQIPRDAAITWVRDWRPLHQGGLDDLLKEIIAHDYRLIVIDTLATSLPGVDHNKDVTILDNVLNKLHRIAVDKNMGVATNDHTRKSNGMFPDPIDDISGNTAKSRNADNILALYVEGGRKGAILRGRGREVEAVELKTHFDKETFCWQLDGQADLIEMTDQRREIIEALRTLGKCQEPVIRKVTKIDHAQLYKNLQALTNAGLIKREGTDKVYYWVEETQDE